MRMPKGLSRFIGVPREYVAAVSARRRLAALPDMSDENALEFARSFTWHGGRIRPTQQTDEILWLLGHIRREAPRTIVEIGTDEGGTLFLWSRAAPSDAVLVAVDTRPLGPLGRLSRYALVRRAFARNGQRIEFLLPRDSHDPATVEELRAILSGVPIDFLFIDGDHTYDGVRCDFELYSPLVRPGGIIALHDIASTIAPGVSRFWSELTEAYDTEQRIASEFGIGLIRVRDAA